MANPTPKQQKVFAITQIIGGMVAAMALGYSALANMSGAGDQSAGYLLGILTLVALAYTGFHTQRLGKIVEAEKKAG